MTSLVNAFIRWEFHPGQQWYWSLLLTFFNWVLTPWCEYFSIVRDKNVHLQHFRFSLNNRKYIYTADSDTINELFHNYLLQSGDRRTRLVSSCIFSIEKKKEENEKKITLVWERTENRHGRSSNRKGKRHIQVIT